MYKNLAQLKIEFEKDKTQLFEKYNHSLISLNDE